MLNEKLIIPKLSIFKQCKNIKDIVVFRFFWHKKTVLTLYQDCS